MTGAVIELPRGRVELREELRKLRSIWETMALSRDDRIELAKRISALTRLLQDVEARGSENLMNAYEKASYEDPAVQNEPAGSRRAAATLAGLRGRLEATRALLADLRQRRAESAYDGVGRGGPAGRALAKLREDIAATEADIEDLEAACGQAEMKLASSRAAAAQSAAVEDARHAEEFCQTLRAEAEACHSHLSGFRVHIERFLAGVSELRRLNYGPPTRSVELQVERAIGSSLSGLRMSPPAVLPPSARVDMPTVAENLSRTVEDMARRVINGTEAA